MTNEQFDALLTALTNIDESLDVIAVHLAKRNRLEAARAFLRDDPDYRNLHSAIAAIRDGTEDERAASADALHSACLGPGKNAPLRGRRGAA